jgi:O-antigen/teichoic acid export membrane protein
MAEALLQAPSIKRSYFYNLLLTGFNFFFPVIWFAYAARILGPAILGKVSFAQSFVNFFALAACLGIPLYGSREIAAVRDNPDQKQKIFSELFLLNGYSTLFFSLIYLVLFALVPQFKGDPFLFICAGLLLFCNFLNIDWLFQSFERYEYLTKRNLLFKIGSLVFLFILVKTPQDYYLYTFLSIGAIVGSYTVGFIQKNVSLKWMSMNIVRHLRSTMILFGSAIFASTYVYLDTVVLGFLTNNTYVGYYAVAARICRMSVGGIASLGVVLIPRISYYLRNGMVREYQTLAKKSIHFLCLVSFPLTAAILALAPQIVGIIAGNDFSEAITTVRIYSIIIPIIAFTNFIGMQILLPNGEEKALLVCTSVAAVVDMSLNFILIPILKHNGAAIAVAAAEFSALIVLGWWMKKKPYIPFKLIDRELLIYSSGSIAAGLAMLTAGSLIADTLMSLVVACSAGTISYLIFLKVLKEPLSKELVSLLVSRLVIYSRQNNNNR